MARRRITVADDAEILVHWRAGRGIREIARSLGYARNTVKDRIATATAAGFAREGPPLSAAQWRATLAAAAAESGDRERRFPAQQRIEQLGEKVPEALKASTAATVWQRLHDAGELDVGRRTFQRYVRERIRSVDPARLTVPMPDPLFGETMEIDYGRMGMWTDPKGGRRCTVWAFVATLRGSNVHFVRPVLRMDQATWIRCHIEAADFFGGSARFWTCDNLKTGVLKADLYDPRLNRGYRECAEHYGALIDPARIFSPK
ncbi:MAG: IS21 family transposase, partial [Longimicrobiales bacterium]